jgi:hypothetical protein
MTRRSVVSSFPRKREPRDFSHLPLGPRLRGDDEFVRPQDLLTASYAGMTGLADNAMI